MALGRFCKAAGIYPQHISGKVQFLSVPPHLFTNGLVIELYESCSKKVSVLNTWFRQLVEDYCGNEDALDSKIRRMYTNIKKKRGSARDAYESEKFLVPVTSGKKIEAKYVSKIETVDLSAAASAVRVSELESAARDNVMSISSMAAEISKLSAVAKKLKSVNHELKIEEKKQTAKLNSLNVKLCVKTLNLKGSMSEGRELRRKVKRLEKALFLARQVAADTESEMCRLQQDLSAAVAINIEHF
jgi:hypothetical protein